MFGMLKGFGDYVTYRRKGLLSKKIPGGYSIVNDGNQLYFNCPDDRFSFKIHHLELGDDATFWQGAVHKNRAQFTGFVSRLDSRNLRGVLEAPSKNKSLGLAIQSGRVQRINPNVNAFMDNMEMFVNSLSILGIAGELPPDIQRSFDDYRR
jgi:hypothetical protein